MFEIKKNRRSILLCVCVVASIFMAACSGTSGTGGSRTIPDGLGRQVGLPERVERAISLAPSITEMVFAAGAGDRLVGVTTYCDFPAEAAAIEKVGDTQTPNIERIIALEPDVVLVSTASQLEAFTATLASRNIAVFVVASRNVDSVMADLIRLGVLFGTEEIALERANALQERLNTVSKSLEGRPVPRVFVQISKDPLVTVGSDSFITDAIARAGGRSVTADVPTGYPVLSKETALAYDPEIILLSDSSDNREPNPVLGRSSAAVSGRIVRIEPDIISRPGPRLVDAIERLAAEFGRRR